MKKSARKSNDRKSASARRHSGPPQQQFAASGEGEQYGEGNYAATRRYDSGLRGGKVK